MAITLCDWRLPDADPASAAFVARLAGVAHALATALAPVARAPLWYAPVDEIAFLAYALADTALLRPWPRGRCSRAGIGRNLVRGAIAACRAIRAADPRARFVHVEPVVLHGATVSDASAQALHATLERIAGRAEPELGGDPRFIDLIGLVRYGGDDAPTDGAIGVPALADVAGALEARHGCPVTLIERNATDLAWTPSSSFPTCAGTSRTSARSTSSRGWPGTGASCMSRSPCSTPATRGPSFARPSPA
jgi:hypothetical protein